MAPQYSLPTRLRDYIAFLLPWAHGHQLKAIGDFVAAIIEQQTACQAQLARYFGNQEAAVKRLSRSLNLSQFVARIIWRRRGVSPLCGRAHRLQRRELLRCLLVPMDTTFDLLQTAIN